MAGVKRLNSKVKRTFLIRPDTLSYIKNISEVTGKSINEILEEAIKTFKTVKGD